MRFMGHIPILGGLNNQLIMPPKDHFELKLNAQGSSFNRSLAPVGSRKYRRPLRDCSYHRVGRPTGHLDASFEERSIFAPDKLWIWVT